MPSLFSLLRQSEVLRIPANKAKLKATPQRISNSTTPLRPVARGTGSVTKAQNQTIRAVNAVATRAQ